MYPLSKDLRALFQSSKALDTSNTEIVFTTTYLKDVTPIRWKIVESIVKRQAIRRSADNYYKIEHYSLICMTFLLLLNEVLQ